MAVELGFVIETGGLKPVKRRADGRLGFCVGDEALLWQALQESEARANDLANQLAAEKGRKGGKRP